MSQPILSVQQLTTEIAHRDKPLVAVDDLSFDLHKGEIVGLVGESGSGKSMTGFSLLGLMQPPVRIRSGRIILNGTDLLRLSRNDMRALRGNRIAMIFQDPMMTLNPVLSVETQMVEAVLAHQRLSRAAALERCRDMLGRMGIASPDERLRAYPHQFSGGMRQRVAIAIALLNNPDVVIADEPTTALDVTIQGQILFEIQKLCRDSGTALLWITHDLAVVSALADRLIVMYAGQVVEQGPVASVIERPKHPYTAGLIESAPSRNERGRMLRQIPGTAAALHALPTGCSFRPRCAFATAACMAQPRLQALPQNRSVRCFHPVTPLEEVA
jgi:peptide/nickel transport system ATP-binding protein